MAEGTSGSAQARPQTVTLTQAIEWLLLAAAVVFFAMHFLHLRADFPNGSPWVDWSKYTDEGWYGDAAIRHFNTGHWYWQGDFNPAVALPVWPAIELLVFRFTGVSPVAARATTVCIFGLTLVGFYFLLRKFARVDRAESAPSLAPGFCVFLFTLSPYFFVFERMAILEPVLIALTVAAMLCASALRPGRWGLQVLLGVLLPAMVLTKTPGLFLFPALGYLVWARAGYRLRPAMRLAALPAILGLALWVAYFVGFVRPHYLKDYQYLFSANAYTGFQLQPLETVAIKTFTDGVWMGQLLYGAFYVVLVLILFWRPRLFRNPLVPAMLLWIGGYTFFLAYHFNLQPRYYTVVAAPIVALVALGLDNFRQAKSARVELVATVLVTVIVVAVAVPGAVYTVQIATQPTYTFEAAAHAVAAIVREDKTHSNLVLSISGSDLSLMTGLPTIDDDFGTLDLGARVKQYRPGWYAAWNELDDDKMDALMPLYHVERVAAFPAMDDPDRNLLILYRLDPTIETAPLKRHKKPTPKPLQTKVGQQPTTVQLEH